MRNRSHGPLKSASARRQATLPEYLIFNSSNSSRLSTPSARSGIGNKWKFRCMRRALGILCNNLREDDIKAIQHRRLESQIRSRLEKGKMALEKQLKIREKTVEELQEHVEALQTINDEAREVQEAGEVELLQIKASMKQKIVEAVAHRQREVVREKQRLHKQISSLEHELQQMKWLRQQLTLLDERHRTSPETIRDSESLEFGGTSAMSKDDSYRLEEVNQQLESQFPVLGGEEEDIEEVWVDVDSDIDESTGEITSSGGNHLSDSAENDQDSGDRMEVDTETVQTLQNNSREVSEDVEKMASSMSDEITSSGVADCSAKNEENDADVNNNMGKLVSAKKKLSETRGSSVSNENDVRSQEEMKRKPEAVDKLQDLRISLGQGRYCLVSDEKYFQINWKEEYGSRLKKICCKRCSMRGTSTRDMKDHSWHKHHGGTYKCPFCVGSSKSYIWRASMRHHICYHHPDVY